LASIPVGQLANDDDPIGLAHVQKIFPTNEAGYDKMVINF